MASSPLPFSGVSDQDRIRVLLQDGSAVEGAFMSVAGMAFVIVRDPGALLDRSTGPFDPADVASVSILRRWTDIKSERFDQLRGERFPGAEPQTATDFEYRLQRLARAMALETEPRRRAELERQFNDTADQIALSGAKRQWVRLEGRWALTNNAPPALSDLWSADVASPSLLKRPRPQDFDPDPAIRRRRIPLPAHVANDPRSVPNVVRSLLRTGLKARVALAGDPAWRRAEVQIDLRPGRSGRFMASARPDGDRIAWRLHWGGNYGPTASRHHQSALRLPEYAVLRRLIPSQSDVRAAA